ncbi:MAG: type IV toxin-antitoxin system AbiEi family antitoxin domain-containing protein [Thermodesulfobacteriota bacterium]|nr:type IV toxin-antitoxin system AbiEi family antitoxin domain-containing protein [Thermodesulfobacteriota bacterium]
MRLNQLRQIRKRYFGYDELARVLGIAPASARVAASRFVRQGVLVRIKRNMYMLREVWQSAAREEVFAIANLVQVPSYISLTTALDYYDITTQIQRAYYESVATVRTKAVQVDGTIFRYTRIAPGLYSGFRREKGVFIATPEKALVDAFYLMSLGRYALDLSALDGTRLDVKTIRDVSRDFPEKTRQLLRTHGYL